MIRQTIQRILDERGLVLPARVWDTHVHCFEHPPAAVIRGRALAMPHAPVSALRAMQRSIGVNRTVMIQVSPLDAGHDGLLRHMEESGPGTAGIARLGLGTTATGIERLHRHGVRGCRFYWADFIDEHTSAETFRHVDSLAAAHGWHLLLHVQPKDLLANEALFRAAAAPIVIDHLAHLGPCQALLEDAMGLILDLQRTRSCFVKLSSGDRWSLAGPPGYDDLLPLYRRVIENDATRVLWATDWPHVLYKDPYNPRDLPPDDGNLLALLLRACRQQSDVDAILCDTPEQLYR